MINTIDKNLYTLSTYLLKLNFPKTITQISKELEISRKIIYYNLSKINDFLNKNNIDILINQKNKGIFANETQKKYIKLFLTKSNKIYILKPNERILLILLQISIQNEKLTISDLEKSCLVSKNTIISDLNYAKEYLKDKDFNLKIENDKVLGYFLKGYSFEIIQFVYTILEEIDILKNDNFKNHISSIFEEKFKNSIYYNDLFKKSLFNAIQENIDDLGKTIKNKDLNNLLDFFPYLSLSYMKNSTISSLDDIKHINETLSPIKKRLEYKVSSNIFKTLEKNLEYKYKIEEVLLFALILLCIRKDDDTHSYSVEYKELREFLNNFILIFENYSMMNIINKKKLVYRLTTHFKALIFRKKYNIISKNYFTNEIKNEYSFIFENIRKSLKYLEEKLNIYFYDGDVAYITAHFLAILEDEKNINKINILIITDESSTIIELLKNQIKNRFNNFNIVDIIETSAFENYDNKNIDYILSTNLKFSNNEYFIIYINSILDSKDMITLQNISRKNNINYKNFKINLKNIINSNIKNDLNDKLYNDIINLIENSNI